MKSDHDLWTTSRIDQWDRMTAADRGREFDARLRAGHRLVEVFPGTDRPTTAAELRERFVAGRDGFDVYAADVPIWPLMVGPGSSAMTPSVPATTAPTPAAKATPAVVPAVAASVPVVTPPAPAPTKASINAAEIFERRRQAQSPTSHHVAPTRREAAPEPTGGREDKPATRASQIDAAAVFARRRGAQG